MKPLISKNCRIRHPNKFSVGDFSVIDDFSYFSAQIRVGRHSHIASGCTIGGGKDKVFSLGDYCSISAGVRIWCSSNDFVNDLVVLKHEISISDKPFEGDVIIGNMCGIGSNTVIMPKNNIPEGVSIGALSFVPFNFKFEPWTVYAGIPIKKIGKRNKKRVLYQVKELESSCKGV